MHLHCLTKTGTTLYTPEHHAIDVWELAMPTAEQLTSWANSFRQNYCLDAEIDALREGTGLSRADYLTQLVFPDQHGSPGPSIRAGDFAELLISDFVENVGYWVPRGKYAEKASRNESVKGVDTLGFKCDPTAPTIHDTLIAFEVKAQLTGSKHQGRLQVAINDSSKDLSLRRATTLNALKRRLIDRGEMDQAQVVSRFQSPEDNPYLYQSGAALVISSHIYNDAEISLSEVCRHENVDNLSLMIVRGQDLMQLVHQLYQVAADEA